MERFLLDDLYGPAARIQRAEPGRALTFRDTLFSNVNSAMRREVFELRPFSDRIRMSEDQDWSRYWLEQGRSIVYLPEAAVLHSHDWTLRQVCGRYFDSGVCSEGTFLAGGLGATLGLTRSGAAFLGREAAYLVREGHARWLPYAALYEGLKVVGLTLGRVHRFLPRALCRRLSLYGYQEPTRASTNLR